MNKIDRVEIFKVDLVPMVPRSDAIQSFVTQETPFVRVYCSDGSVGTGYSYTIGTGGSSVVALLADHLAPRLIGRDADEIESIWKDLFFATHATAVGAITSLALAAIDTALWDARCRRIGLPLWKAAGGAQRRVPVYSTEGGWLHLPIEELVSQSLDAKAAGLRGVKVKVGRAHVERRRRTPERGTRCDRARVRTDGRRQPVLRRGRGGAPRAPLRGAGPRVVRGAAAGRRPRRARAPRREHLAADRGRRVDLLDPALSRVPAARCLLDRAGRRRANRRHHALAQGGAPRRELQRPDLPALPDGACTSRSPPRCPTPAGSSTFRSSTRSRARACRSRTATRLRLRRPDLASTGTKRRSTRGRWTAGWSARIKLCAQRASNPPMRDEHEKRHD